MTLVLTMIFDMTGKAQAIKAKNQQVGLYQTEKAFVQQEVINKMKRQPTD